MKRGLDIAVNQLNAHIPRSGIHKPIQPPIGSQGQEAPASRASCPFTLQLFDPTDSQQAN